MKNEIKDLEIEEVLADRIIISQIFAQTMNKQQDAKNIKIPEKYLPILVNDSARSYFLVKALAKGDVKT